MDARDLLTEDGRALLLLCSTLAGAEDAFTLTEWNQLARRIHESPLQRPAALVGQSARALAETLGITGDEAERIVRLLERGGRVALELETLFSRGLWVVTRVDPQYPAKLRASLKHQSPPVLFGAGTLSLLKRPGIAVVGSRNIDEAGTAFAQAIGRLCAEASVPVVSGGARGTDSIAMTACVEAGGVAFGVLADSLERSIRQPDLRQLLLDERLVLLTPYAPSAGFSVGAAMGRNKIIYGLAEYAVVVSSELNKGGTWAGAIEALRAGWCPVFVRHGDDSPAGNKELLQRGAASISSAALDSGDLRSWLEANMVVHAREQELFASAVMERPAKYRTKR
jgi:predicted Rossmann fold nucleotide-binding protein DprA/Smf involved in DNA uptake